MNIFLSASIPVPDRDTQFFGTADVVSIREAVKGLALVLIEKEIDLVFGGHPAITPLIVTLFRQAGFPPGDHVTLYQSEYFRKMFPSANENFTQIVITEDVENDREKSLLRMRERMISDREYACGIFIGGMEGVLAEYDVFRRICPEVPVFPVSSTGAAAAQIFENGGFEERALIEEYTYPSLFRHLLSGLAPPVPRPTDRRFNS